MRRLPPWPTLLGAYLLGALGATVAGADTPGATAPQRIVSLNICTDGLLLELVERRRIASVTFLSLDPRYSPHHRRAAGLHINHGHAEELLPLRPDLVLAGSHAATATAALLDRLGYRVLRFEPGENLQAWLANLRRLAAATGDQARAAAIAASLPAWPEGAPDATAPRVLALEPGGWTAGPGSLTDHVITAAGLRNAARDLGLRQASRLDLEQVLMAGADLLIVPEDTPRSPSLAHHMLQHPALAGDRPQAPRQLSLPARLWTCPGTHLLAAVEQLRGAATPYPAPGPPR